MAVLLGAAALTQSPLNARETPADPAVSGRTEWNMPLEVGFRAPPERARPRVWWHWMNGNVSDEGARLDLEWMHRVGIGGVHIFSGALPEPVVVPSPQPFMSEGWKTAFRDSIERARASGMEVGIAGSPGWSLSGGPWVKPDDGMKKYVWSETRIVGGRPLEAPLAMPPVATGPFQAMTRPGSKVSPIYRDALVVAWPTPLPERAPIAPVLSSSDPAFDLAALAVAGAKVSLAIQPGAHAAWIEARYPMATTIRALTITLPRGADVELDASNDGQNFTMVTRTVVQSPSELTSPLAQQTIAMKPTLTRVIRVILRPIAQPGPLPDGPGEARRGPSLSSRIDLAGFQLEEGARANRFEAKAGFQPTIGLSEVATPDVAAQAAIPRNAVIDLTSRLRPDGSLDWVPPKGDWTILRFGWSLTGATNGPAEPAATGLEVDKLDAAAVQRYLAEYLAMYRQAAGGQLGPQGVGTLVTDSWEAGVQNWTPRLPEEFRTRRGYDLLPFLPILAGHVVESAETSDRFLWDFRQTLKDLLADNHYRVIAEAAHALGMTYYTEAQGDTPRAIADAMTVKARSDIPTGEFWFRPFAAGPGQPTLVADLEEAASAAHVYGKPLVAAEALTVAARLDPWAFSPAMLKPVADEIFARGVNRILLHESHLQPLIDAKPGLRLSIFGQFFNRNDTWAEDAKPWMDYLSRTSYLLQQGRYVADIATFYGEATTPTELAVSGRPGDVPSGYHEDYINPEALLTLLSVRKGRIATASGMEYRILYLPAYVDRLTLPAMRKLRDLVKAGAVLVAHKPAGGLGLASPDAKVLAIADAMWGAYKTGSPHVFGKGRIYGDLTVALAREAISPDVTLVGASNGEVLTQHRHSPTADIYFLTNRTSVSKVVEAKFRVTGRRPELWHAETGTTEPIGYSQRGGFTTTGLTLLPNEAVFMVFAHPARAVRWSPPPGETHIVETMDGPWTVAFQPGRGAPATATFATLGSWTASADPGVRYFSGAATYAQTAELPAALFANKARFQLDLGDVRELATVTVNGQLLSTAWHAPYRVDVTRALKPGPNRIEVRVVNLWPNRLIGDKQPGATPIAVAPQSPYLANSPLMPSGLLGPVRLLATTNLPTR